MREDNRYLCRELLAEGKDVERLKLLTDVCFINRVLLFSAVTYYHISYYIWIVYMYYAFIQETDENPQLQLLLMMTDLLASCAEGENSGTESVCCTIYTMEELIKIIRHDGITLYRKRPFTRFLVWVYMNVGKERISKKAQEISQYQYV